MASTPPPATSLSVRDFFAQLLWAMRRNADEDRPFLLAFLQLPDGRIEAGMRDGATTYKTVSKGSMAGFEGSRAGLVDRPLARMMLNDYFGALRETILKRTKGSRK